MQRGTVLLIGGSGFLGGWVAARLAEAGLRARVPCRPGARRKWRQPVPGAEFVTADVNDDEQLAPLLDGVDAVVNLVGILHDRDEALPYGRRFAAAHVALPQRIVAAMRQSGVRRLIQVSALRASAQAPSAYLRSKAAGEAQVLGVDGIDATVFRPSVIFAPNDAFLNLFAALLRVLPVLPLAGASARFQPVYAGDVAAAIVDALTRDETVGGIFELAGPRIYTLRELVGYVAACRGVRRWIVGLPAPLAYLQARIFGLLPAPPISPDNLRSMRLDNVADGRHDYPGWRPTALETVAPAYLGRGAASQNVRSGEV